MNRYLIAAAAFALMIVDAHAGATTSATSMASSSVPPTVCDGAPISATGGKTSVTFPCGTSDGADVGLDLNSMTEDAPPNYVPRSSTLSKSSSAPKP